MAKSFLYLLARNPFSIFWDVNKILFLMNPLMSTDPLWGHQKHIALKSINSLDLLKAEEKYWNIRLGIALLMTYVNKFWIYIKTYSISFLQKLKSTKRLRICQTLPLCLLSIKYITFRPHFQVAYYTIFVQSLHICTPKLYFTLWPPNWQKSRELE